MQVLVVDDDNTLRETMIDLLRTWGYDAWGVENGKAAIEFLADPDNGIPSLILLDLMMPVMNGEEFLACRESNARLKAIPVVVFSATPQCDRTRTADGYVNKPYVSDIRPFLEKYCSQRAA